jgi:uncharacterized protein
MARRRWPLALITGASAGIGHEFARQLAARGSDLVLVARDVARLEALAALLRVEHGRSVEVLPADLTDPGERARVEARLGASDPGSGLAPVDLLVNNAGFGTGGQFHELPIEREEQEIELNVVALVRLAHAALGGMRTRRFGAIVNVSSLGGFAPVPELATYSATKAFVSSFSQSLRAECRGTGVSVMALCPGYTRTEFQERSGYSGTGVPEAFWTTAEQVVRRALADLDRDRATSIPGVQNKVGAVLTKLLPAPLVARVAGSFGSTK